MLMELTTLVTNSMRVDSKISNEFFKFKRNFDRIEWNNSELIDTFLLR